MTYRELMVELSKLTEEQLDLDVTVVNQHDEWFPVSSLKVMISDSDDVLDNDHPYLVAD